MLPDRHTFNKILDMLTENLQGSNKRTLVNKLYKILADNKVEGRYRDEHWLGISKLQNVLNKYGVQYDLTKANYIRNPDQTKQLPSGKKYEYEVMLTDDKGQTHIVPLIVNCAFVGRHGTMEDDVYELTYYFAL